MDPRDPHISLVTLGVDNVDRAVAFDHEGLGVPVERWDTAAFFELGGAWLAVSPRDALAADGGTLTQPARETDGGGYPGDVADPDGHLWEGAWNPHADLTGA